MRNSEMDSTKQFSHQIDHPSTVILMEGRHAEQSNLMAVNKRNGIYSDENSGQKY
jgi:hypothetical protein